MARWPDLIVGGGISLKAVYYNECTLIERTATSPEADQCESVSDEH